LRRRKKMVVKLQESDALVLILKEKEYNIENALKSCKDAEDQHLPMYLIAKKDADVTELMFFPWRINGVFRYEHDLELIKIMQEIRKDLKWIRSIGV
jgi:hypothetical protein